MFDKNDTNQTIYFLTSGADYRRYRLIFIITFEALIFNAFLIIFNPTIQQPSILLVAISGTFLALLNLFLLNKYHLVVFAGYTFSFIVYTVALLGNLLVGGPETSLFIWLFLAPVVAAATTNPMGLIFFGTLSSITLIIYLTLTIEPYFLPKEIFDSSTIIINYIFFMTLMLTILFTFMLDAHQYQKKLLSQQKALESDREKFHYLSRHDVLTNLPNRALFYQELEKKIKNNNQPNVVTVFYMDLNDFKAVNDNYGHETGDLVLKSTANRLAHCFREEDLLARMGGDEFTAFVMHHLEDGTPEKITKRIEQLFTHPYRKPISHLSLSISVGTATYPVDANNAEELVNCADKRMYKNKKATQE